MVTPYNKQQKLDNFAFEKRMRPKMDLFYSGRGYRIRRVEGNEGFDLFLNGAQIEEKFRAEKHNDILIEFIQDISSQNLGWFYKVTAIQVNYVMC